MEIKETFLYIKRHSITGLLYFGKTGELNPFYGKTHSEETKIKLRMPKSEEAKLKFKQAIRPKCTCPHCGKRGHVPLMKRWYFDKCKHKID